MQKATRSGPAEGDKEQKNKKKPEEKVTRFLTDRYLGELYYCREDGTGGFIIYDRLTGNKKKQDRFELDSKVYAPDISSDLIKEGIIKIPSGVADYGSIEKLLLEMQAYFEKYVEIKDKTDRDIVLTYVLLTWVYRRFSAIPYLRVIGDWGSGKSRLLKVLNVCYKSIYTSGNTTEAPIFRMMHKYGGTLIIDEAELSRANDRCEGIMEILRFGKDRDGVVPRCEGQNFDVKAHRVFGPKILGSRRSYSDDALESRIISVYMKETTSDHIPLNLNVEEFDRDCKVIREKLLSWSLDKYFKLDTEVYKKHIDSSISKRLNEMNSPLTCIRHWDSDFIGGLLSKARTAHQSLMEDKSLSLEANIVRCIQALYGEKAKNPLLKDIAEDLVGYGTKKEYSSRFIGSIIRNNLGLATGHSRYGNIVIVESQKLDDLIKEYNL